MLFTDINCPFLPGSFDGHLSNATHQDPIAITRKTIDDQCESIERLPEIVAWIKSIYAIETFLKVCFIYILAPGMAFSDIEHNDIIIIQVKVLSIIE